jgi:hypothetical protein
VKHYSVWQGKAYHQLIACAMLTAAQRRLISSHKPATPCRQTLKLQYKAVSNKTYTRLLQQKAAVPAAWWNDSPQHKTPGMTCPFFFAALWNTTAFPIQGVHQNTTICSGWNPRAVKLGTTTFSSMPGGPHINANDTRSPEGCWAAAADGSTIGRGGKRCCANISGVTLPALKRHLLVAAAAVAACTAAELTVLPAAAGVVPGSTAPAAAAAAPSAPPMAAAAGCALLLLLPVPGSSMTYHTWNLSGLSAAISSSSCAAAATTTPQATTHVWQQQQQHLR